MIDNKKHNKKRLSSHERKDKHKLKRREQSNDSSADSKKIRTIVKQKSNPKYLNSSSDKAPSGQKSAKSKGHSKTKLSRRNKYGKHDDDISMNSGCKNRKKVSRSSNHVRSSPPASESPARKNESTTSRKSRR